MAFGWFLVITTVAIIKTTLLVEPLFYPCMFALVWQHKCQHYGETETEQHCLNLKLTGAE